MRAPQAEAGCADRTVYVTMACGVPAQANSLAHNDMSALLHADRVGKPWTRRYADPSGAGGALAHALRAAGMSQAGSGGATSYVRTSSRLPPTEHAVDEGSAEGLAGWLLGEGGGGGGGGGGMRTAVVPSTTSLGEADVVAAAAAALNDLGHFDVRHRMTRRGQGGYDNSYDEEGSEEEEEGEEEDGEYEQYFDVRT